MEMSNLVEDLVEEILCKLPITAMGAVRLTCKKWNSISKRQSFAEKHINKLAAAATRELSMIMLIDEKVYLMGLHNNINGVPSITRKAELVGLENVHINRVGLEKFNINGVYSCDGLLLCSTKQAWTRGWARGLVVWNPYWRQTKWIRRPKHFYTIDDYYAMGYEVINNSRRSHKILKFCESYIATNPKKLRSHGYEIYDFKYNSWKDVVITSQERNMDLCQHPGGVSLKGNTYWFSKEQSVNFLICFDFTRERFGPRMSLPCVEAADNVVLSGVKGEKLAVLVERLNTLEMEIWITSEISPTVVSWSKLFLTVRKRPFGDCPFSASDIFRSFFIDEENHVVVFVARDFKKSHNMAYIYGVGGGYLIREVDLGKSMDCFRSPMVCSYAPSSVLIG